MPKHVGLDMGTSNLRLYMKGRGIVLRAPSVVAVDKQEDCVVALGREAKSMIGKTPAHIQACRPIKDGVVSAYSVAVMMLHEHFKRTQAYTVFNRPVVLVGAPCGHTEAEAMSLENLLFDAGAKAVGIVHLPMAAAIGAGLRVGGPRACMVVDIGGGTTEIAVIRSGGIVASKTVKLGGNKLDVAIINSIKNKKGLCIGEISAEMIKVKIGSANPTLCKSMVQVSGRNETLKCAQTLLISSADISEPVCMALEAICRAIRSVVESTPPEVAADIADYGIMLTGGGACILGAGEFIAQKTRLRVTIAKNPMDCVCLGLGKLIEHPEILSGGILYTNR